MMMGAIEDRIYRPQLLTCDECWSLLSRISLNGKEGHGEFEDVGKKIAIKCNGLPLAVNVLGSVLQFKHRLEEWENVLESELWQLGEAEIDLYPHLLLSYYELSPTLKRCFSYCAVYPKDSKIEIDRLIGQWMALGYLGCVVGNPGVELKGKEYFNNLELRSLLRVSQYSKRKNNEIKYCRMHDIVHDFARFLKKNGKLEDPRMTERTCHVCYPTLVSHAQEYRSLFWHNEYSSGNICDCFTNIRVLGLSNTTGIPYGMEKLVHLRWLDMTQVELSKEDLETVCKLCYLQTLLLGSCSLIEIPEEIGNLVHLRHLDLSNNDLKELPESICRLAELQILNLQYCESLHRLPAGLAQLSAFRILNLFIGGSGRNKLGFLKKLNSLTGYLRFYIFVTNSKEFVEDAREAKLKNKIHLRKLHLYLTADEEEWCSLSSSSSSLWLDVIDALEPNQNLQVLDIWGYKGSRFPNWISSPLNLLIELYLGDCSEVSSLPLLGKLPFLEKLFIQLITKLKVLGVEWLDIRGREGEMVDTQSLSSLVAFPKLKKLTFVECSEWEEWEDITAEEEESASVSVMPCLTKLRVCDCEKLKMLPHRLLRKASSLRLLSLKDSLELIQCYGEEDGSPWRSISLNNQQLQLHL